MSKNEYIIEFETVLKDVAKNNLFINTTQVAKAVGVARETAAQMLFKLRYKPNGKEKLFLISEVANVIYNSLECDCIGGAA